MVSTAIIHAIFPGQIFLLFCVFLSLLFVPQEVAEIRNGKVKQQGRPIQDSIKKVPPCQIVTQQMEMMIFEMIISHRLLF